MELLIGLIVLAVIGVGVVFWMLKNDTDTDDVSPAPYNTGAPDAPESPLPDPHPEPETEEGTTSKLGPLAKLTSFLNSKKKIEETTPSESKPPTRPLSSLIGKFKEGGLKIGKFSLGKKKPEDTESPEATHFASLKDYFGKETREQESADEQPEPSAHSKANKPESLLTGTASITTTPAENRSGVQPLSDQEDKIIDKEIELSAEISELKERCSHLESMLKEKSAELETARTSLDNELRNRKDFNKVKDILEKDLKDAKDKARLIQIELSNAQSEGERQKKRITLLEEKITRLEKDILEKEDKIDELVKRLQTFASPSTSAVPPLKKEGTTKAPDLQPPKPPEKPQTQQPLQEGTSLEKDVFSPPEPRTEALYTSPAADKHVVQPGPVPEPLDEPGEKGGEDRGTPEDLSYPEDNQADSEPFLKLPPDVMSGASQSNEPAQNVIPPPSVPPRDGKSGPATKPEEDKQIFKIIDPDHLFGNTEPEKKDKNAPKEKE